MKKGFGLRRSKNEKTSKKVIDALKIDTDFQRSGLSSSSVNSSSSSARGSRCTKSTTDSSLSNRSSLRGVQPRATNGAFSIRQQQQEGGRVNSRTFGVLVPLPPPPEIKSRSNSGEFFFDGLLKGLAPGSNDCKIDDMAAFRL
jgi:hypothetical protein